MSVTKTSSGREGPTCDRGRAVVRHCRLRRDPATPDGPAAPAADAAKPSAAPAQAVSRKSRRSTPRRCAAGARRSAGAACTRLPATTRWSTTSPCRDKSPERRPRLQCADRLMPMAGSATEQSRDRDDFIEAQRLLALIRKATPITRRCRRLAASITRGGKGARAGKVEQQQLTAEQERERRQTPGAGAGRAAAPCTASGGGATGHAAAAAATAEREAQSSARRRSAKPRSARQANAPQPPAARRRNRHLPRPGRRADTTARPEHAGPALPAGGAAQRPVRRSAGGVHGGPRRLGVQRARRARRSAAGLRPRGGGGGASLALRAGGGTRHHPPHHRLQPRQLTAGGTRREEARQCRAFVVCEPGRASLPNPRLAAAIKPKSRAFPGGTARAAANSTRPAEAYAQVHRPFLRRDPLAADHSAAYGSAPEGTGTPELSHGFTQHDRRMTGSLSTRM